MLTIHTDGRGRAYAVRGEWIAAVGDLDTLTAAFPAARLRRWPGILTAGLVNLYGPELLDHAYHPDPREADTLGTEPLTGPALDALRPDDTRWGASARRGVQRMLAHGTVAVAGSPTRPAVAAAVRRSGIGTVGRLGEPQGPASLDPFACGIPADFAPDRQEGSAARFAVFDVKDEGELAERGASGTCVATVVEGRIVYRRR
ncbi:hypothetical protein ABZX40_38755 [Streptomyces sp. NPDC004610]|uniref:imidazolonepropionase-like domain-containing protein n=1 Tax=unclassified Streptomyces TaxID=2593676 RepID=UPI0033BC0BCC